MPDPHLIRQRTAVKTFFQATLLLAALAAFVDRTGVASLLWSTLHG